MASVVALHFRVRCCCGKASMIAWLLDGKSPYCKLSPVASRAFCFLMCLRGYSNSLAEVITSHSCGVAAWIWGGRDHGNSHFSNRLNLDAAPV